MILKKGTHGVLENGNSGVKVPAEVYSAQPEYLSAIIDGAQSTTIFRYAEQWVFTPDKPKLPTEDGYYVTSNHRPTESNEVSFAAALFQLSDGTWSLFSSNAKADEAEAYAQKMLETNGLTRVKLVYA